MAMHRETESNIDAGVPQGDLSTLDEPTRRQANELGKLTGGGRNPPQASWPFIWGTIRILAIYGSWSWWRDKA
jgi:hypothetical protein